MPENPKNSRGEEILVDPGTPAEDRATHPKEGDLKVADSAPGTSLADAELHDPPVRSNRAGEKLIQRLGVGSGQHTPPPEDANIDADGRYHPPLSDYGKLGLTADGKSAKK